MAEPDVTLCVVCLFQLALMHGAREDVNPYGTKINPGSDHFISPATNGTR